VVINWRGLDFSRRTHRYFDRLMHLSAHRADRSDERLTALAEWLHCRLFGGR
jgi:hypothetical protein